MIKERSFAQSVLQFNNRLAEVVIDIPNNFKLINPFGGDSQQQVERITKAFYNKFYGDDNKRYMILGSSPARRGTAVLGVPFESAERLQKETGVFINNFYVNKSSSNFLYEVIDKYGGSEIFYKDFYMNFVCPLGIVRKNPKGNYVNCNYYENKQLKEALYSFIVDSIREQLCFNIDTSICYCIGSGENYKFLCELNQKYSFFENIIPLEHPRFITQYNRKDKDAFMEKYLCALNLRLKI